MAKKQDYTAADRGRYSGAIGALSVSDTKKVPGTKNTIDAETTKKMINAKKGTRPYTRFNPLEEPPEEYRFTVRMPGEFGRFMNELAYQRRSTITAEFARLVEEEMERRPEILASLDELNK